MLFKSFRYYLLLLFLAKPQKNYMGFNLCSMYNETSSRERYNGQKGGGGKKLKDVPRAIIFILSFTLSSLN